MKPSYIYVPLFARIIFGVLAFLLLSMLFIFFYVFLAEALTISSLYVFVLPLSVATALPFSLILVLIERILKRLCKRWDYSHFRFVELFFWTLFVGIMCYFVGILILNQFVKEMPLWVIILNLILLVIVLYTPPLLNFFDTVGIGVLYFKTFLRDFKKKSDDADFGKLVLGAKKISKIAQYYNMQISPYSLALGMTISFLEKEEATRKDFNDLIEWIENSTKKENFKKFRKLVKKYNSIAEKSAKEGIKERYGWTAERIAPYLGAIVTPIVVATIIHVVPKLLEILD